MTAAAVSGSVQAGSFRVRLLRRVAIGERQAVAGAELLVDAQTAHQLVVEGAASLADERDIQRLVRLVPNNHRPRVLTR